MIRRAAWSVALIGLVGATASAAPGAAAENYQLVYKAPTTCPSRDEFVAAIHERTLRVQFVDSAVAKTKTLRVAVLRTKASFVGELEVTTPGADPSSRHFSEASCSEVISALALVAALTIDPGALLHQPPEAAPPPSPAPPTRHRRRLLGTSAGVSLVSVWGPAPTTLVTVAPTVQVFWPSRTRWQWGGQLTPAYARSGTLGPGADNGSFRWQALHLAICPSAGLARGLRMGPCLLGDVAALKVEGRNVPRRLGAQRPWYAGGLGGELTWHQPRDAASARAGRPQAFVRVGGGVTVPLIRDRFLIRPEDEVVHEPGIVGGDVELTTGLRFP